MNIFKKSQFAYFVLAFVCSFTLPLLAQEKTDRKGSKAVQFDFYFQSFISGRIHGIAGKYWWTNDLAMRAGLMFKRESYEQDYYYTDQSNDEVVDTDIRLSLGIEKHFKSLKKLSPYIGGKIGVRLKKYDEYEKTTDKSKIERKNPEYSYSVGVLFGVEYWITKNISLSGHHGIDLLYSSYTAEENGIKTYESSSTNIYSSTSCLILSIYL